MISYLKVKNLAIVANAEIEPGEGLNVLTGETGAGKSLLIDSLQFLGGGRASSELVRADSSRLVVEGVLYASSSISRALTELGIDHEIEPETDEIELVVRREMASNGRGRAQINGTTVTIRALASLMEHLIEIHGQHQSVTRIGGRTWREMLDDWAGHQTLLETSRARHDAWRSAAEELERLRSSTEDRTQRIDTLRFQIAELTEAAIEPGEATSLREERSVLTHAEELAETTTMALELIQESDESASSLLGRVTTRINRLARDVESLQPIADELEEILIRIDEAGRSLASIGSDVRHDPDRLEEVEARLALIERLQKKYSRSDAELSELLHALEEELVELEDFDTSLETLEEKEKAAFEAWRETAETLSQGRKRAAADAASVIETELASLAMERARVRLEVATRPRSNSRLVLAGEPIAFGPEGYDAISMSVSMNPGEPLRELSRVASGGELSRLQLAIASAAATRPGKSSPSTLVFDEIDAGVGGRIADVVGRKLRALSESAQLICVTHLPQIAGLAATQFHVEKNSDGKTTHASVRRLEKEERVTKIAEMLAGQSVTGEAIANARRLLESEAAEVTTS